MSVTEIQQRLIDKQENFLQDYSELLASLDGDLSPEQEKLLALLLGEWDQLGQKIKRFIKDILHEPG